MTRALTPRERAVLDALLAVDFDGAADLRAQARVAVVAGGCPCGCPSIDFAHAPGSGLHIRVNATVEGTSDGLFLYTVGGRLGGIEWVSGSAGADPDELPEPSALRTEPA